LFQGIIDPWNGVLLYGMPGCGKTMLAKAVASECKTTFFNISASSIVSKWRGESEKLVRVLFEMARHYAPSTIFLDEIDSIMSSRDVDGEHEGSRRMKTELLIQMDGLARTKDHVFILATSNIPWQLDMALIRRLEKRIFIGMPDFDALVSMLRKHLPVDLVDGFGNQVVSDQLDYRKGAEMLNGYSGSDVKSICKEAIMMPLRLVFEKLSVNSPETRSETDNGKEVKQLQREVVTTDHLLGAISKIRPSCNLKLLKEYEQWAKDFGST
jgi:katanin p60 ATPase-containing subunit A1